MTDRLRTDAFVEVVNRRRAEGRTMLNDLVPDPDDRHDALIALATLLQGFYERHREPEERQEVRDTFLLAFAWGIWCAQEGAARLLP